jgi:hypothetical protein
MYTCRQDGPSFPSVGTLINRKRELRCHDPGSKRWRQEHSSSQEGPYIGAFGCLPVSAVLHPSRPYLARGSHVQLRWSTAVTLLGCALEFQALPLAGLRMHLFTRRKGLSPIHSSKRAYEWRSVLQVAHLLRTVPTHSRLSTTMVHAMPTPTISATTPMPLHFSSLRQQHLPFVHQM